MTNLHVLDAEEVVRVVLHLGPDVHDHSGSHQAGRWDLVRAPPVLVEVGGCVHVRALMLRRVEGVDFKPVEQGQRLTDLIQKDVLQIPLILKTAT